MPIITIGEIVDLILMTIFVGYIFSDIIPVRRDSYDPLTHYRRGFEFKRLKIKSSSVMCQWIIRIPPDRYYVREYVAYKYGHKNQVYDFSDSYYWHFSFDCVLASLLKL